MRRSVAFHLMSVLWLGAGVGHGAESAYPYIVSEEPQPVDVRRSIRDWLECYECNQGELQRVVRAGVRAVPILEDLAGTIDPAFADKVAAAQRRVYGKLRRHAERTGAELSISEDRFVSWKVREYFELQQARARQALDLIADHSAVP